MKIDPVTFIFGLTCLAVGWISVFAETLEMIQLRQIAIVLLVLFFYSLNASEIEELKRKTKSIEEGCECTNLNFAL